MHRPSVVVARRGIPLAALLACALVAAQARAESRVENPFAGADWYVSPEYAANVGSSMNQVSDQTLKNKMSFVASQPTAFWLDRIAAIKGTSGRMGLAAHLDAALSQQKNGKPMVVMTVIYDLPGRDCAALASNGELGPDELDRYKTEYIDPIVAIEGNSKYASLRIVNIVEIDSLPNIVTNVGGKTGATALCDTMKANGNYVKGVQYALSKLYAAGTNTYNYVDAGHHGWLGWDSNFSPSAQLLATTAKGATGGADTVAGFITNTSNYSALVEPFVKVTDQTRASTWLDWNYYVDEKSFATAFRNELVKSGMNSKIGMLIDTSRNGWGGPARPKQAVTTGSIDEQVDGSRVDRRFHAGNWCNQTGAGLGERPQVVGQDGIHAYVWVKPPGESDGSDTESGGGKGVDQMCDPSYGGNARNKNNKSGAMAGAPLSGKWFHAQFVELVKNALPEIPGASVVPTPTPIPGGDPTPTPTPTPTPAGDFTLTVSPSSLTLNQGESGKSTILIGKSSGFSGMVALSASGLPNGVTATFSPTPTDSQSTLTLSASSSATTGSVEVTITATSGSLSQTKKLSLTVNAAGAASFSLSASPTSVSIDRGATKTSTITVQPAGGFSGSVSLSADNLPEGVTANFSPQSTSSNSTVTFSVASNAPAGSATVTIVGTSSSPSVTKSTTLSLTVNAAGGSAGFSLSASPGSITVRRGSSATSSLSLTALGGFTGGVALSASGAPSGVTISFSPTSASASAPSTATITAASTASLGPKEVTIQGTSGSITGTATLWVTVTDSSSPGGPDGGDASGTAAGGCGCATTGPGDAAIVSLTMLAAMMLWLRRRA